MSIPTVTIDVDKIPEIRAKLNRASLPASTELDKLVGEYSVLLDHQKATKESIKDIEIVAQVKLLCSVKAFRTYARAIWQDALEETQSDLEDQLSLFGGDK